MIMLLIKLLLSRSSDRIRSGSRNMHTGYMDKAKEGRIEGGKWGWLGWVGSGGVEMETTRLE